MWLFRLLIVEDNFSAYFNLFDLYCLILFCHVDIYKALYDGPDPANVIESLFRTQSQNSTQQLEIDRLKKELSQYDEEFQQLKNQDITIRRLEDQIADFQESIEDQVL